jgi:hypothetical protein
MSDTRRIAGRNTEAIVGGFESDGTISASHNWPAPPLHTLEMSEIERESGIFIEATEFDSPDESVVLALSPREAKTLARALYALASEVDARVALGREADREAPVLKRL